MSHFICAHGGLPGLGPGGESVPPHPLTFPMLKGVGRPSSGCQVGLPVFFLFLIPTPFLSVFMDPLAAYSRDGV